jgi:hypothetical protein
MYTATCNLVAKPVVVGMTQSCAAVWAGMAPACLHAHVCKGNPPLVPASSLASANSCAPWPAGAGTSRRDQVVSCIVMLCQLAGLAQLGSLQALDELMRNMCCMPGGEQTGGPRRMPQDLVVELLR